MADNIIFGISNIFCGLLFIAISIPLIKRKIKMNSLYGFRVEKAFKSEKNWYDINAYGGKQLAWWSIPIVLIGLICLFLPKSTDGSYLAALLGIVPVTLFTGIAIAKASIYIKNYN